jgi:O-antigen/teichoic acid export membrane protein
VWGFALLSLHKHREILWLNLVTLVVNATLVFILASVADAVGAAIATTIGEAVLVTGGAILTQRAMNGALSWTPVLRTLAALALPMALLLVPGLSPLVSVMIGVPLFIAMAFILKAVPQELTDELRTARSR